jgi:hypothetical protein
VKVSVLLSVILIVGCAASNASPAEPWRIEVTSSGGLAGRGAGDYAVASDGTVTAKLFNGRACTFQLTPTELGHIRTLLARTKRKQWKESYIPEESCCDRFTYVLTVDEAGAVTTTKWIDSPLPMPPDLEALADAMVGGAKSIRVISADRCQ